MKITFKKFMSLFLAVILLLSIVPMTDLSIYASAKKEGYYTYTISSENAATITKVDTSISGDITIPTTLGGYVVKVIGNEAFFKCEKITSVTIGKNVTTIEDSAFKFCEKLENISISESVTEIGTFAFLFCSSLKNIFVDKNNNHFSNDENGVLFSKDKSVLVRYPVGLKEKEYTIPSSVNTIGNSAFDSAVYLETIIVPDSVNTIEFYAFDSCVNLKNIRIPYGVKKIEYNSFSRCQNLTGIEIPNSVKYIENSAFYHCDRLKSINIPDSVISIGESAFYYCTNLEEVTISKSVTSIGEEAFLNCPKLQKIIVNPDNNYYSSSEDGVLFNKDKSLLICYPIGNTASKYIIPNSVYGIYNDAFSFSKNLIDIIIPDTVSDIGEYAFYGCVGLEDITISQNVSRIRPYTFYDCIEMEVVHYFGTEEDWKSITIDNGSTVVNDHSNDSLLNADVHFLSVENIEVLPTCTSEGFKAHAYCEICDKYFGVYDIVKSADHNYKTAVTSPTCKENGYTKYTCSCGDTYVSDKVEALGHNEILHEAKAPSCLKIGWEEYVTCSRCDYTTYVEIGTLDHKDDDGDYFCDYGCGYEFEKSSNYCSCNCHQDGFMGFIWKILRFFYKLFGTNKTCGCGVSHY